MDKLLWVLSPLVLAGAVVGVLAWRGRLPSRLVLNVGFSLLLLLYLLVTAGLGIFWVANQHLPVFDWHYLFGYAMLVLLAVHLGFNFRVVWNTLRRRQAQAVAAAAALRSPLQPARRPWLGALGVLGLGSALGSAYWIGLRHGRTELRVVAGGSEGRTAAAAALALVETFHEFSSHSRAGLFRRAASSDWGERPAPFKMIEGAQEQRLPPPLKTLQDVGRPPALLTLQGLATLLWHTAGVSEERGGIVFRTAPSSGALFAAEFYLAARALTGLAPGLWHYRPHSCALALVQAGAPDAALAPADAPAALIATAIWRRSGHKYGDRTYRYVLADLGHALENTRQVAAALGGSAMLLSGFDEAALAGRLRIDQASEGVLAQLLLHTEPVQVHGSLPLLQPASLGGPAPLGVTEAVHLASSLRGEARWSVSPGAAAPAVLPDPLPLIAARRSRHRYSDRPLSETALAYLLAAMTAPAAQLSSAVRLHVLTHAVQGRDMAAWHWQASSRQLVRTQALGPDARRRSRAAGLDQEVIGDAAAVFVLGIDRAAFGADPAGPARGYRHAFIEAGLVGERLYLQAQALGLGVCAVGAFYDDEAAALVGADPQREWIVHFAAVGALL